MGGTAGRLLAAAVLILVCAAAAAANLTAPEFTRHYLSALKTRLPEVRASVDGPLSISTREPGGLQSLIALDNAYTAYLGAPQRLDVIIERHIAQFKMRAAAPAQRSAAAIFAVLKPDDFIAQAKAQMAKAGRRDEALPLVFERLAEGLNVFYVFDAENGMQFVQQSDLAALKLDPASIRPAALKNLQAHFEKHPLRIVRLADTGSARIFGVELDDNYEASILLLARYLAPPQLEVDGDVVAFVPARNMVFLTGSKDAAGLRLAARAARQAHEEMAYPISASGYVYRKGLWTKFQP